MAKRDFHVTFTNATISLKNNEIVEYSKKKDEPPKTYRLSNILEELEGDERRFNIKITESFDIEPDELG